MGMRAFPHPVLPVALPTLVEPPDNTPKFARGRHEAVVVGSPLHAILARAKSSVSNGTQHERYCVPSSI